MEIAFISIYTIGILAFLINLLRDTYVTVNIRIILIYILASIIWPITGLLYILDVRK
jgi:hypothetical protein